MKYDIPYMTTEAVSLLKSLISIPSISREETQAADFLQNYIEMTGMQTGRKGNNVWCFSPMFDLKKPTILLNSHIDTVKPVNGWRKDPFTPREENGKLYGLGSNDAGASVVSLLQVFLQLCRTSQKYNLIYLASCEEEVSGKDGIESVLPGLPPVSFAIVGEPTAKRDYTTLRIGSLFDNPGFETINEGFGIKEYMLGGYFAPIETQLSACSNCVWFIAGISYFPSPGNRIIWIFS